MIVVRGTRAPDEALAAAEQKAAGEQGGEPDRARTIPAARGALPAEVK